MPVRVSLFIQAFCISNLSRTSSDAGFAGWRTHRKLLVYTTLSFYTRFAEWLWWVGQQYSEPAEQIIRDDLLAHMVILYRFEAITEAAGETNVPYHFSYKTKLWQKRLGPPSQQEVGRSKISILPGQFGRMWVNNCWCTDFRISTRIRK
jgi:hypothetical protein